MKSLFTLLTAISLAFCVSAQPELEAWILSDGSTCTYYNEGGGTYDSGNEANVQLVQFSDDNVYIQCTGIPSYPIGPYPDGNPSTPGAHEYLFQFPRNPQAEDGTLTSPGLGHIGLLINGVPIYNASDAMFYGVYERCAPYWEAEGFDCAGGHPSPNFGGGLDQGFYHHHQNPTSISNQTNPLSDVCDDHPSDGLYTPSSDAHSPLIGFAFDGFPIYGCYGFDNTDGTGEIVLIQSSYQFRDITDRTTDGDGNALSNPSDYGPPVNETYPLGAYIEDHEFIEGSGHLDVHNGRFCVTPEYPLGTYAYFATVDENLHPSYPYFVGPSYYGVVETDNFGSPGPGGGLTNVSIDEEVDTWTGMSIGQLNQPGSFEFFPNPATEVVTLVVEKDSEITVYDPRGEVVLDLSLRGRHALNVSSWSAGLYLILKKTGRHIETYRLAVVH